MKRIALGLLLLVTGLLTAFAAPEKNPPYYGDPKFEQELAEKQGPVRIDGLLKTLERLEGVKVLLPGAACRFDLQLPAGKRRLRDALDFLAEIMLGEWKEVSGAYVLVMEPHQLEVSEMTRENREKAARALLQQLLAGLTSRQKQSLAAGGALTQVNATPGQRRTLNELGALTYWSRVFDLDPKGARGQGVSVSLYVHETRGELLLNLPTRRGTSAVLLREPITLPAGQ